MMPAESSTAQSQSRSSPPPLMHAAAALNARRYELLASTYRPVATRATDEPKRALPDKTPLTEDFETGPQTRASTPAWMSLTRIVVSCMVSTWTMAAGTQPGRRGRMR